MTVCKFISVVEVECALSQDWVVFAHCIECHRHTISQPLSCPRLLSPRSKPVTLELCGQFTQELLPPGLLTAFVQPYSVSMSQPRAESNQTLDENLYIAFTHLTYLKPSPSLLFFFYYCTKPNEENHQMDLYDASQFPKPKLDA